MHAQSHITRAVAAMDSCFALIGAHQHGIAVGLSMVVTARVIWLCACVRYWLGRGLVYVCLAFSWSQNLTPKKTYAEFQSHINFQKALNDITRQIDISFECPPNILLKSS